MRAGATSYILRLGNVSRLPLIVPEDCIRNLCIFNLRWFHACLSSL
jgi:hypothetical protein